MLKGPWHQFYSKILNNSIVRTHIPCISSFPSHIIREIVKVGKIKTTQMPSSKEYLLGFKHTGEFKPGD